MISTLYVRLTWIKIGFEFLYLILTFIKLINLNVKLLFSICISLYFSIIRIRKYVIKRVFITSVTQVNALVISLRLRHQMLEINRKTCQK